MENLEIAGSHKTPEITFNKYENKFIIRGHSRPMEAASFYEPVKLWLRKYLEDPNEFTHFEIQLDYFNVSSVKELAGILAELKELKDKGKRVRVSWYFTDEDADVEETALEFSALLQVPTDICRLN